MSRVPASGGSVDGSGFARERRATPIGLLVGGAAMAVVAAILLWLRFGPSTFIDALNAVWTCL